VRLPGLSIICRIGRLRLPEPATELRDGAEVQRIEPHNAHEIDARADSTSRDKVLYQVRERIDRGYVVSDRRRYDQRAMRDMLARHPVMRTACEGQWPLLCPRYEQICSTCLHGSRPPSICPHLPKAHRRPFVGNVGVPAKALLLDKIALA